MLPEHLWDPAEFQLEIECVVLSSRNGGSGASRGQDDLPVPSLSSDPRRTPSRPGAGPQQSRQPGQQPAAAVTPDFDISRSSPRVRRGDCRPALQPTPRAGSRPPGFLPKSPRPRGSHLPANWTSPPRDSAVGPAVTLPEALLII